MGFDPISSFHQISRPTLVPSLSLSERLRRRLLTDGRLRAQFTGCVRLTDPQRISLDRLGKRLCRKALEEGCTLVSPVSVHARRGAIKWFDLTGSPDSSFLFPQDPLG